MSETIGARVKRLRQERGLSQREMQEKGISYAYISRVEANTRRPSVKALRLLAEKLGVTPEYLEFGIERTTTDDLVDQLWKLGLDSDIVIRVTDGGVQVEYERAGALRSNGRHLLTEALLDALRTEQEVIRIEKEMQDLEAQHAALTTPTVHLRRG